MENSPRRCSRGLSLSERRRPLSSGCESEKAARQGHEAVNFVDSMAQPPNSDTTWHRLQSSLTKVALFLIAVSSIKMSRHWSCSSLTRENRIELPNRRAGQSGSFARKAVAELVPEILEISGLLRHGRAEALKRWLGGPDRTGGAAQNSENLNLVASKTIAAAYAGHWHQRLALSSTYTQREDWCRRPEVADFKSEPSPR
jgi:hypothetical protein